MPVRAQLRELDFTPRIHVTHADLEVISEVEYIYIYIYIYIYRLTSI